MGAAWVDCNAEMATLPTPGHSLSTAVMKYDQNTDGSFSVASSETHAAALSAPNASAIHPASSVVFPKPAGATTMVSFCGALSQCVDQSRTRNEARSRP